MVLVGLLSIPAATAAALSQYVNSTRMAEVGISPLGKLSQGLRRFFEIRGGRRSPRRPSERWQRFERALSQTAPSRDLEDMA
jgi:hypothetical protein